LDKQTDFNLSFYAHSDSNEKSLDHVRASFPSSVRRSAYISAASTGRISVKFGIWDVYENLSRNSKLVQLRHLTWKPKYVLLFSATLNRHK